jgi:hypothetical protein
MLQTSAAAHRLRSARVTTTRNYVGTDVVDARPGVDWAEVEHVLHPQVQAHWNTRCWVTNLHERAWAHTERKPRTPGLDAARALAEREAVAVLGAWARVLF